MGRWDHLADRKSQELKEFVLDQVAQKLAEDLGAFPPPIDEWLDPAVREKYREVLVLRNLEQLSVAETAEGLAITPGAVKVRHLRALERLRARVDEAKGEDSR